MECGEGEEEEGGEEEEEAYGECGLSFGEKGIGRRRREKFGFGEGSNGWSMRGSGVFWEQN